MGCGGSKPAHERARWRVRSAVMWCFAATLCLAIASAGTLPSGVIAGSEQSEIVVDATIASATNLTATNCGDRQEGRTEFGELLPETDNITPQDCELVWGSNNDSSQLKLYQADGAGKAMWRHSDGSIDTGFDGDSGTDNGVVRAAHPMAMALGQTVAVAPDGDILVGSVDFDIACNTKPAYISRYNSNGTLDTAWDGDGHADINLGATVVKPDAIWPASDGSLMFLAQSCIHSELQIGKLTSAGAFDTTFGSGGFQNTGIPALVDDVHSVMQNYGRIVVVNSTQSADSTIYRLGSNGRPDLSFSSDGMASVEGESADTGIDSSTALALQPDGKIVVAGATYWASESEQIWVARMNSDGTQDTTFGTNGSTMVDVTGGGVNDYPIDVAVAPGGRIFVAGLTGNDTFILAFTGMGQLEQGFSGDGKVVQTGTDPQIFQDSIFVQDDGYIVVGRQDTIAALTQSELRRYKNDGNIDTTFAGSGAYIPDLIVGDEGNGVPQPFVALDGSLMAMWTHEPDAVFDGDSVIALAKFTAAGTVQDYDSVANDDWDNAADVNLFGACLRQQTGAGVNAIWTVDGNNDCTATDSDPWKKIVTSATTTGAKIAESTTVGTVDATTRLRFGFRTKSDQPPDDYYAPLVFEVVAPNAPE